MSIPRPAFPTEDKFVKEAITYVEENFPDNYGSLHEFRYATSHSEAEKWMDEFFRTCFDKFGDYEDAIVKEEAILFHSVLTLLSKHRPADAAAGIAYSTGSR